MTTTAEAVAAHPSPEIPTYLRDIIRGNDTQGLLEATETLIAEARARCNRAAMQSRYEGNVVAAEALAAALDLVRTAAAQL